VHVLIIGGSGNLSRPFARHLADSGHTVTVLNRGKSIPPPGCRCLVADRTDADAMRMALQSVEPDVVVNFLGFTVPDVKLDYILLRGRIAQYIFISSATVYAKPHRSLPITEEHPLGNPFSEYARNKEACEIWLSERIEEDRFPVTIVRPSHTYSEQWIPNPVSSAGWTFAARLLDRKPVFIHDDGRTPWTLTAASDFAAGLAGLVGLPAAIGETVHITSDEVLTWSDIYRHTADALGVTDPAIVPVPTRFICDLRPELTAKLRGDKAEPGVFDNTKIRLLVPDFRCRIPYLQGIRASVAWFQGDPSRKRPDPVVDEVFDAVLTAWNRVGNERNLRQERRETKPLGDVLGA
jgi:nucleoside-diphosphate-sugar epimerase